jgi:hypothetical protein
VAGAWRSLRRRLLTPGVTQTKFETRGFHARDDRARRQLESIGGSFVAGFGHATYARTLAEAEQRLEEIEAPLRGFAYEGAAMGLAIMDALGSRRGRRVERFLAGRARDHAYMVNVGVGWALARLPRWRWRAIQPTDPLLRWLALDGYGFHQGYFHTDRYIDRHHQDGAFGWPGEPVTPYANRVVDQGIGRVLWFVEGADSDRVASRIDTFAEHRRGDLYSGAGLAATYAGGADAAELHRLWDRAGAHRPAVAQGSAFAAKARIRAGLRTPHTDLATSVFCGTSAERAAQVTDEALVDLPADAALPAFEVWRRRITETYAILGRC